MEQQETGAPPRVVASIAAVEEQRENNGRSIPQEQRGEQRGAFTQEQ